MFALPAYCFPGLAHRFAWRRSPLVAAVLLLVALPVSSVRGEDWIRVNQEAAKACAMQAIAVIQAQNGDDMAAKRTVSQIGNESERGPSDVVAVCCFEGHIFYDHLPGSFSGPAPLPPAPASCRFGWGGRDSQGNQYFLNRDRAADRVPAQCPPGLRPDYLDPDPHHGAVVDFADEHDSRGTRITSRKYADGYMVIETPQPGRK
jgi:hypothetical protein